MCNRAAQEASGRVYAYVCVRTDCDLHATRRVRLLLPLTQTKNVKLC
jgi:hypothetical protein